MEELINDPEASAQPLEPVSNPLVLNDFMNALQRLFRIGVYYPSGHVILDQATDRFLALLVLVAQERHFVRIEDNGRDLLLEKVRLDGAKPFVTEFRKLMAALSITAMEINRDISRKDVSLFIRRMIACRSRGVNTKQFASIEITDLPDSVSVTYKQFLARENESADSRLDSATRNLNAFYEALAGHGLSEEQIDQCRTLLAVLPEKMGKISLKSSDLPSANWDDVALLLAQAVQGKPLSTRSSSHGNLDMLASILSNLEKETEDRKSREAINLLVSIIRKPKLPTDDKNEDFPAGPGHQNQGHQKKVTANEIQEFTDKNRLNPATVSKIQEIPTETETLSVLMQVVQYKQSLQNQTRILQFLNDIFAASPREKTWEILTRGLLAIVRTGDRVNLTVALRLITEPLRRLGQGESMALFLKTMELCEGAEESILWPFAVSEILICGSSSNIGTYRQLCVRLSGLPWKNMVQALPVLQSLDAHQRGQVATDIFSEMIPSCYQLCAFLLRTSIGPLIGGYVVAGLKNSPSDKMIKAVSPLLDPSIPEHKAFLDSYLRHPRKKEHTDGLKIMAGNIIVERLTALPQEQRDQPWVADTIEAMAEYQGTGGRELLNQIITTKRMFVIPEWPAASRKAAEEAMNNMRRRPRIAKGSI
jgi:hypothetical protein